MLIILIGAVGGHDRIAGHHGTGWPVRRPSSASSILAGLRCDRHFRQASGPHRDEATVGSNISRLITNRLLRHLPRFCRLPTSGFRSSQFRASTSAGPSVMPRGRQNGKRLTFPIRVARGRCWPTCGPWATSLRRPACGVVYTLQRTDTTWRAALAPSPPSSRLVPQHQDWRANCWLVGQ